MEKQKNKGQGALFIPAGLFLGVGLGLYFGNVGAWTLVGMGAGFFFFAVSEVDRSKK